jgi:hypothetical protein
MRLHRYNLLACGVLVAVTAPVLLAFDFSTNRDQLWAQFKHPVVFADRLLPEGKYLFVHDDDKSALMEPCLYVYGESNVKEPLLAIHCLRKAHAPSERDKVVLSGAVHRENAREFGYIQFAGDAFAHYLQ